MSANLGSIRIEILLVGGKLIGIEFLGKRISLDDRREDIRNRKSIELDTLLGHP